jgi:hypothetical protein
MRSRSSFPTQVLAFGLLHSLGSKRYEYWGSRRKQATMMQKTRRVPASVKIAYTAFMAVLVAAYLHDYGPTNFL